MGVLVPGCSSIPRGRIIPTCSGAAPAAPVAGYALWLDASQITGVADGAALSSWPDQSANAYNFTATTTQRPTYYKTTAAKLINGNPAVWFNGTSNVMGTASGVQAVNATDGTWTAFLVGYHNTTAVVLFLDARAVVNEMQLGVNGSGLSFFASAYLASGTHYAPGQSGLSLSAASVVAALVSSSAATAYVNGAAGTPVTVSGALQTATQTVTLGAAGGTGGNFVSGPICELLIYPSALSAANMAANQAYLKAKWGTP